MIEDIKKRLADQIRWSTDAGQKSSKEIVDTIEALINAKLAEMMDMISVEMERGKS